jgi:hypothetical protein
MIMAQEEVILKARAEFDRLADWVRQTRQRPQRLDAAERQVWSVLLKIGRLTLEAVATGHGPGDVGLTLEYEGRTLNRLPGVHERRYVSVFGELTIPRRVYGTRETQKHEVVPLDAVLGLPAGDFSYVLQDWDQAFCVQGSYAESRRSVERILGIGQSVRSLEHMNVSMAQAVEGFRESQPAPPAGEEGRILVFTADGKGVPMCRDPQQDPAPPRGRRQKGEKANKKRQACVGAVYTIGAFERTAEEVVDEVMRDRCQAERPSPCHKEVRAELTREVDGQEVNGKERIFAWFAEEKKRRDPADRKAVVCVMDGDRSLWTLAKTVLKGAFFILDLFHVLERLWQAAHCFHAEGSEEAKAFVTDRLQRILEGKVGYVIAGLRKMAAARGLRGSRRTQLNAAIGYLHRNRRYMKYDIYLQAGFPIGSGVAEGACRHLIKDRMEQAGMRWRIPGAQAMLDLRAVYLNGDWEAFQKHRVKEEQRDLYPYLKLAKQLMKIAA